MNARERYLETLLFGKPDRVPFAPGGPRESTLAAWHSQGLPADAPGGWFEHLCREIGIPAEAGGGWSGVGVSFQMIPDFEEKILERRPGSLIVQDWKGNLCEIADRYDPSYLRHAKDFVTRRWIKCPVESRADWEQMKSRYNPRDPARFAPDFDAQCRRLRERSSVAAIRFNGPFWQLREWCGFEGLCVLLLDDPEFAREMIRFWGDFVLRTMAPILERVQLDAVGISEDMAYKAHSMISPAMVREFQMPVYREWVEAIRASGCPIIDMDSDGCVDELIPLWIESGINVCDPVEVAAGNDIVEFRRRFGRRMAYQGGIDKRAMARGGETMRREVLRVVPPLLEDGGFIPGCDHAVPADVSWPNYVEYARLLAQLTGWL